MQKCFNSTGSCALIIKSNSYISYKHNEGSRPLFAKPKKH